MRLTSPIPATERTFRWIVLLLLSSTLVLGPATVRAEHDLTCHPSPIYPGDLVFYPGPEPLVSEPALHLSALIVRFAEDGTPTVHGTIVIKSSKIAENSTTAAQPWTAIAESAGSAQAQCSDRDGDGGVGLVSLTADFRNARTDDTVRVTFVPDGEIDASGTYAIAVRGFSTGPVGLQVNVRLSGGP